MVKIFILHKASTTNTIGWLGFFFGLLGTVVALIVAWFNTLRKAKIVGVFSGIKFEKRNNLGENEIKITGMIKPYFILKNVGARPAVIENIKLVINLAGTPYSARPYLNKLEGEIEEKLIGIMLRSNQTWENSLTFKLEKELVALSGDVSIKLKLINKRRWVEAKVNKTTFSITEEDIKIEKFPNYCNDVYSRDFFKSFRQNKAEEA